jgi:hypothetical protein
MDIGRVRRVSKLTQYLSVAQELILSKEDGLILRICENIESVQTLEKLDDVTVDNSDDESEILEDGDLVRPKSNDLYKQLKYL